MSEQNVPAVQQDAQIQPAERMQQIKEQVNLIQHVMKEVMRVDEHYGLIPGCGKKQTLFKSGAEKLILTFRLVPEIEVKMTDMPNGHKEYVVLVTMWDNIGRKMGMGTGSCSTMEGKYRFRTGEKTLTEQEVPKAYWDIWKTKPADAQAILGVGNGKSKGDDNKWYITKGGGERVEHDNPADYYNTVLKMAKKRALVDATLTVTAASDIFTQDIEDMPEVIPGAAQAKKAPPQEPAKETAMETEFVEGDVTGVPSGLPSPTDKGTISDAQVKMLNSLLTGLGIQDDMDRHIKVSELCGYEDTIGSMSYLSKGLASSAITALKEESAGQ
jgi:hypothetical protein